MIRRNIVANTTDRVLRVGFVLLLSPGVCQRVFGLSLCTAACGNRIHYMAAPKQGDVAPHI
jgi:hypothetical protein